MFGLYLQRSWKFKPILLFRILQITGKCLHDILKLQHLEELLLEGCFGVDDDSLKSLRHDCKSLKVTSIPRNLFDSYT
jgi:hypothetical protein